MNNNNSLIPVNNNDNGNYCIIFSLKNQKFAINIKNVIEVINIPFIDIYETATKGVIGTFTYKGLLINVIDLCPFVGQTTEKISVDNKLIMLNINDEIIALNTEEVINIINLDSSFIHKNSYETPETFIKEIYKDNTNIINIINTDTLGELISNQNRTHNRINYFELFPNDEESKKILLSRNQFDKSRQEIYSFNYELAPINQYVLFICDEQNYYLDLKYVKEFSSIKKHTITKLPYTQEYIRGIINIKGKFLLAVDLKKFLNNETENDNECNKIMIIEGPHYNIALCTDEIKYITTLNENQIPLYADGKSKYIKYEFIENNVIYNILDIEKILNDERLFINID